MTTERNPDSPPAPDLKPRDLTQRRLLLALVFIASAAFYWHGFGPPGDAERYTQAAFRWLEHGPNLGVNHWALRHLFVVPMAASFALFGPGELAASIPNILYAAGLVAITYGFTRRYAGEPEGLATAGLIAISAFFVARPMEIGVYGPEVFFGALACWCFIAAQIERRRVAYLVAAGFSAGLAWTLREQTIFLIVSFGLLTLIDRRQMLISIAALALGFGSILALEWLVYLLAAGDPFYRYKTDLHHRVTGWATLTAADQTFIKTFVRPFKDASTDPITTPLFALAIISVLAFRWRITEGGKEKRRVLLTFGFIAAMSAVVSAYGFDLALPRYYPIFPYLVVLVLGAAVVATHRKFGRWAAIAFLALILGLNVVSEDFSSYEEYQEPRYLARMSLTLPEPIYTDRMTASRARYQLRLMGMPPEEISPRFKSANLLPVGVLFFKAYPTVNVDKNWCALDIADVRPVNLTHYAIRESGLAQFLGAKMQRIVARPAPVMLVRVLEAPASSDPVSGRPCLAVK
jgi:hypothetical protein